MTLCSGVGTSFLYLLVIRRTRSRNPCENNNGTQNDRRTASGRTLRFDTEVLEEKSVAERNEVTFSRSYRRLKRENVKLKRRRKTLESPLFAAAEDDDDCVSDILGSLSEGQRQFKIPKAHFMYSTVK